MLQEEYYGREADIFKTHLVCFALSFVPSNSRFFSCLDRVVDEMQPKNHFTRKQQDTLLMYNDAEPSNIQPEVAEGYDDEVMQKIIQQHHEIITKVNHMTVRVL